MTTQTTVAPAVASDLLMPSATAAKRTLRGSVGPGFTIALKKGSHKVTRLKKGRYVVRVSDRSDVHNFHLMGPGVDRSTSVRGRGTVIWKVRFTKGAYTYVCDPHAAHLNGSFRVSG
jgi:hypothetical protein